MKYLVTYEASWNDRTGVLWVTGKQTVTIEAQTREEAILIVRGNWPEGAHGVCTAQLEETLLLDQVRRNMAEGKPPSIFDHSDHINAELLTGWVN